MGARTYLHRWAETAGAQLLVVDPGRDEAGLTDGMAGRGVHVTWVSSTVDGLVEFGRLDPHTVVVSPDAPGLPAADFVTAIRRHGSPYVVAALEHDNAADVGVLMLAGASAVVARPYSTDHLWELLSHSPRSLREHAHVVVGPIELDAASYRVLIDGERIADLPLKEFELLRALLLRAPGVVTDDELREALWGSDGLRPSGNTIAMHVTRLRHRLGGTADVRRIRGRGYSLTVEPSTGQ
ncbi:response regulator transcription factor [Nocardioides antri]|uniref:Response regulator transcription factor n=1 Tax=Nocardioides antri TaxID=2607659 RepID=A0A5B1M4X8_9ACTN|nr:winged helix-turn-helix domain-containing protein [Nocardioides antri]KAA1427508.1 response regulator transcription factor [Nocardioides antri]